MASWDGKSKGSSAGYRIFLWVLKNGGLKPAYLLLRFVVSWYFLFSGKVSRIMRAFFSRLGYSSLASYQLLYRNLCFFGTSLIDRVALMAQVRHAFDFSFHGEAYLRQMVREGKGGLLLSAHLGNWEIAGYLLQRLDTTINIVMYDAEHRQIKAALEEFTRGRMANIIVVSDDLSHIYAIHEALNRNELVCMHADRFVGNSKTLTLDFLGSPARFPAGPFMIASMFQVPVCTTFAIKDRSGHYTLSATAPMVCEKGKGRDGMQRLALAYVRSLEEMAVKYPEQWYNYYDFWHA